MARRSTRLSLKKASDSSKDIVDTAKRRLFDDAVEIEGPKLETNSAGASCQNPHQGSKRKILGAGADTSSVSVVGVGICICCLIIIFLSFCRYCISYETNNISCTRESLWHFDMCATKVVYHAQTNMTNKPWNKYQLINRINSEIIF